MRQCCRHASGVRPAALGSPFLCHAAGPGRAGPGLPLRPQQHMPDPGSYVHQISRTDGFVVRGRFYRTTHLRCTLHLLIAMQSPRCGKPGAVPRTRLKSPPGSCRQHPLGRAAPNASRGSKASPTVSACSCPCSRSGNCGDPECDCRRCVGVAGGPCLGDCFRSCPRLSPAAPTSVTWLSQSRTE